MTYSPTHKMLAVLSCVLLISACATYQYEPRPLDIRQSARDYNQRDLDAAPLHEFMQDYGYPVRQWPLQAWDLHALTLAGYYFNQDLQVAIARHKKSLVSEEVAKIYPNPGIQIPLEYHSDTSGGVSPWLAGLIFDLIYERSEKREARYEKAVAESDVTRISILESAWQVYRSVRRAWADYYTAVKMQEFLQKKLSAVEEINGLLARSFELGQTSEFEMNAMRLELQKVRLELVNQNVRVTDSLHRLASVVGVPVSAIEGLDLSFDGIGQYLESQQLDDELLQTVALTHRLDMQRTLSEYTAFEAALKLEIEKQYPDITLSPGFIFDQNDNIWAIGASWIMPLLHPHNEGPIKLALADREVKQTEIMSLQSGIINEMELAQSRLASTNRALKEAEILMQEAMERNRQLQNQYELGQIDNLVLLRNKLELLSIEGALVDFQFNVMNAAFNYEDVVQYPLLDVPGYRLNDSMKNNNNGREDQ